MQSANLGATLLVGQGAGRYPTANSAVSDVARCAAGRCRGGLGIAVEGTAFNADYEAGFYMRCDYRDEVGIVKDLGTACEDHGVSIFRSHKN